MAYEGHTIYENRNGAWTVGVLMANGTVATIRGGTRYANEATVTLEAIRQHHNRLHMNFVVARA